MEKEELQNLEDEMARLTGEAVSEKFEKEVHFVAKAGKNVVKGVSVVVVAAGLAGCPQPTNGGGNTPNPGGGGGIDPNAPTTDIKNSYDLIMPKPEIGWTPTRIQNEVSTAMASLMTFCR